MMALLKKMGVKDGKLKETVNKESKSVEVLDENHNTHPVTEEKCPKCGHEEAYWWTRQTRASDEPETKFLQCVKCKYKWRDAS